MDDWEFVACDDGCTQPLSYIKRGKKYYFGVAEVLGFGNTGEIENLVWQRPVESSLLLGRVLEIVPDISTPTLKKALDEYRSKYSW